MKGPVEGRVIVGPHDQETVVVVSIPLPAAGEVRIDPAWRFHGWLRSTERRRRLERLTVRLPQRFTVDPDGAIEEDE